MRFVSSGAVLSLAEIEALKSLAHHPIDWAPQIKRLGQSRHAEILIARACMKRLGGMVRLLVAETWRDNSLDTHHIWKPGLERVSKKAIRISQVSLTRYWLSHRIHCDRLLIVIFEEFLFHTIFDWGHFGGVWDSRPSLLLNGWHSG